MTKSKELGNKAIDPWEVSKLPMVASGAFRVWSPLGSFQPKKSTMMTLKVLLTLLLAWVMGCAHVVGYDSRNDSVTVEAGRAISNHEIKSKAEGFCGSPAELVAEYGTRPRATYIFHCLK